MSLQTKNVVLGDLELHLSQFGLILTLLEFEFPHLSLEAAFLLEERLILLLLLIQLYFKSVPSSTFCTNPSHAQHRFQ